MAGVCRDPDDDTVLACAAESGADYLVTGGKDLLVLGQYGKMKILTPRELGILKMKDCLLSNSTKSGQPSK